MPDTPPRPAAPLTPSPSLLQNLRQALLQNPPFAQMAGADVDAFITQCRQAYYAPGELLLSPEQGPAPDLLLIRQGSVSGRQGLSDASGSIEYLAGDLFPVGAVLSGQAVSATYTANEDTFCLQLPADAVRALAQRSAPFAAHLTDRLQQLMALSQRAVQLAWSSQALTEQSLEARLGSLPRKPPLAVGPTTPLGQALGLMHQRRVGSVLIVGDNAAPLGILTRHDILGRVTLAQRPLSDAISAVMSTPLQALSTDQTLQDAALLMSRHGIRHVPITEAGRLVSIVSERDLFALQRLSLKQLGTQIRAADGLPALRSLAGQIRSLAGKLMGQGVQARQVTELISHLNDLLTERLVQITAQGHDLDLSRACWLAFGSEGRGEQTIVTDQDNGLVFASDDAARDRPAWLAMSREINQGLDACGFPLCQGQVMAGNPALCLNGDEWLQRFGHWIAHGAPADLLAASIFFDLRPIAGNAGLAAPLRDLINTQAAGTPRFLRQLADNALRQRPPINWRGGVASTEIDGRAVIDLKLQGTALFVDAARLLALAQGLPALGTRQRLAAAAPGLGVPAAESAAWVVAFELLQGLRLQVQMAPFRPGATAAPAALAKPNQLDLGSLNQIDLSMLKEALHMARRLQQRIALDYQR